VRALGGTLSVQEIDDGSGLSGTRSGTRGHLQNVDRADQGDGMKFLLCKISTFENRTLDQWTALAFSNVPIRKL
jgi:hypothetical protein